MSEAVTDVPFTELHASRLYANLVNNLDAEPFIARLAPDVRYISHWVIEELNDRERVAKLLHGKMVAVAQSGEPRTHAVIGVATRYPHVGMPLVILHTGEPSKPEATVTFDIADGLITRVGFCILGAYKPALLDHPDDYIWPPVEEPVPDAAEPAPKKPRPPDPDPAEIIATFTDVLKTHYAPIEDSEIERAVPVDVWGFEAALVSPENPALDSLDIPAIEDLRESARLGEILLILVSQSRFGVFALVTHPRPTAPWPGIANAEVKWNFCAGKRAGDFMDFDTWCPLSFSVPYRALRAIWRIVARPAPALPVDELERRYREVEQTPEVLRKVAIMFDLATWPRFLEDGPGAAWSLAANGYLLKMRERGEDTALATLVLDAWPKVAEEGASGRVYR